MDTNVDIGLKKTVKTPELFWDGCRLPDVDVATFWL